MNPFRLLLALGSLALGPFLVAQDAPGKKSLAIINIKATPAVTQRMNNQGVGLALEQVVQSLNSQVTDRIVNSRRFDVIDRSEVESYVRESGATGGVFKFTKSDYVLTIELDSFNDRSETKHFASLGRTSVARVVEASAVAKMTVGTTGKLFATANIKVSAREVENSSTKSTNKVGEASDDLINRAARDLAQQLAARAVDFVYPARIIGKRDRVVTINRNDQSGIKVGQVWEVFVLGDELIDPDTGESAMEEVFVGKVRITRVTPQNSQGESIEDTGIDRGAVVRLLTDVDPEEET
jgi:hypothetical protein